MSGKIGAAITTHRRPNTLAKSLAGWAHFLDKVDTLVVIHDRLGEGVPMSKNRSIAALIDAGCDHLFLADDDIWPITPDWAQLYTEDPEPHLMHCWGKRRLVHDDGHYTTWSWPRGVLLYAERRVIDTVGGMRTEFNHMGGGEHVEWSRRIHAAGLTKHRYADLTAARTGMWHAEDYTRNTPSTVSQTERDTHAEQRHKLYRQYAHTTEHVGYR